MDLKNLKEFKEYTRIKKFDVINIDCNRSNCKKKKQKQTNKV